MMPGSPFQGLLRVAEYGDHPFASIICEPLLEGLTRCVSIEVLCTCTNCHDKGKCLGV